MPYLSRNPSEEATPICRCRVLYLGSAVPHVTKDGLQGIQEPLRELYPEQGALGARGIDSWLSVWSNGLLLENVDENHKKVTRFFPIDSLHYCAAVRYVLVPEKSSVSATQPRFLPLDSPFARSPNPNHPPLFAAILRRTTGIKVLECHAFICKREVAANALVRCCFHAYADFSYAKQMENGGPPTNGNMYGTLCNGQPVLSSNSIEKVEGWRRSQPSSAAATTGHAGSTLTLNSTLQSGHTPNTTTDTTTSENGISANMELSNSVDDMSIYNGDENHKMWISSTRDISDKDALYAEYGGSTMRSSRSNRPRQIMNAPPPPPPPPQLNKDEKSKKTKDRARRKKLSEGSRDDLYYMNGGTLIRQNGGTSVMTNGGGGFKSSSSVSGGTMMRGYYPPPGLFSNGGTMLRNGSAHMNGFHPILGPPGPPMMMVPTTLPHPPRRTSTGSYNKSKHQMQHQQPMLVPVPRHHMMTASPPPPPGAALLPMTGPPQPIYVQTGRKLSKHHLPVPVSLEEPTYMPSARPMSPVASYQPGHFPHEAYLMHHYASAMDTKSKNNKKKHKMKKNSVPNGSPSVPHINGHSNTNGRGPDEDDDLEEGDSVYNTGIYKRKNHLNERAFSYSIRQEHRSRSYGSLANLKFAPMPTVPNGLNKEDVKKEREIEQMVNDLDLYDDDLVRSEVPAAMYQHNKMKSTKVRR